MPIENCGIDSYLDLLQCPWSSKPLKYKNDTSYLNDINSKIADNFICFNSGQRVPEKIIGILETEDMAYRYPIINNIPFLRKEFCLIKHDENKDLSDIVLKMDAMHLKQMEKFSKMHEKYYGELTRVQHTVLRDVYYSRLEGCTILDLGNGGLRPEFQLSPSVSKNIKNFIATDYSFEMLTRNGFWGNQALADANNIPLKDNSVDYVLANGIIHHFGNHRSEKPIQKASSFFIEALRVSRKGIIVFELVIPQFAEIIERIIVKTIGQMPTYVYSKKSLLEAINRIDLKAEEVIEKKIGDLLTPFTIVPPILDFPWLKVPVCTIPYSFVYFVINK